MNFAFVTDLVRNHADIGRVTSIAVLGDNSFAVLDLIIMDYVVSSRGSSNGTLVVTGVLAWRRHGNADHDAPAGQGATTSTEARRALAGLG